MASKEDLITMYFNLGLQYSDIVTTLIIKHSISLSERQLKRILSRLGLFRRKNYSDNGDVIDFIRRQLRESGSLHGYRWMYHKCQCHGYTVRKEDVRVILATLDPGGTEIRRARRLHRRAYFSKGPNFIWHMDSYDKLKPFGIGINGCIDGFSRKLIWLNAYFTNSDPKVIGGYYVEIVQQLKGCPRIVRADRGTENSHVCTFQRFLREDDDDSFSGERSFMYGSSTHNQRIESFWGFLRKECIEFYIELFHEMKNEGLFDGTFIDKNLLLFSFLGLIQDELDKVQEVWDAHNIAPSRNVNVPHGKPNIMYYVPELYGCEDYLVRAADDEVGMCKDECTFRKSIPCDADVFSLCTIIMNEQHLNVPCDAFTALELYVELRQVVSRLL